MTFKVFHDPLNPATFLKITSHKPHYTRKKKIDVPEIDLKGDHINEITQFSSHHSNLESMTGFVKTFF